MNSLFLVVFGCFSTLVVTSCPDGWLTHSQRCYHFSHDVETWTGAYTMCKILGGNLLEIDDVSESNFITSHILLNTKTYWIGLTDVNEEGTWVWMTSKTTPGFTNWSPGEPSVTAVIHNHTQIENCVDLYYTTGQWNDAPCAAQHFFICEKLDESTEIIG